MPNNIRINDKNGAKEILTAKERLNRKYYSNSWSKRNCRTAECEKKIKYKIIL